MQEVLIGLMTYCAIIGSSFVIAIITTIIIVLCVAYKEKQAKNKKGE